MGNSLQSKYPLTVADALKAMPRKWYGVLLVNVNNEPMVLPNMLEAVPVIFCQLGEVALKFHWYTVLLVVTTNNSKSPVVVKELTDKLPGKAVLVLFVRSILYRVVPFVPTAAVALNPAACVQPVPTTTHVGADAVGLVV